MASPPKALSARPEPGPGTLIKGRWKLLRKIGQGAFGYIYSGQNIVTGELVAIKVERVEKLALKVEALVLKKLQSCPYVVSFITCGRQNDYNYMVMELLGENISDLRRKQPNGRFSMLTTLKLGLQMLIDIEAVHDLGYLHRDIKPSNFAMGLTPGKRHQCFLIDFGLARRYVLPSGKVRPPRPSAGFRGTARYASIQSHESMDLARRDDLWSLMYVLVEFAKGHLAWRRIKNKDQVASMKKKYDNEELVQGLPHEFLLFMNHLKTLKYEDRPDYEYLRNLLAGLFNRLGGTKDTPFDWEQVPVAAQPRPRPLPALADLCFLKVATHLHLYTSSQIPKGIKKKLLDFLIRTNEGHWPRKQVQKLLDGSLHEIDVSNVLLEEADYRQLISTCTQLRSLSLGPVTDIMLKELVQYNNLNLEQLSFSGSRQLTSKGIKSLGEACKGLQKLSISNSERISDKVVDSVLKSCTNITDLSLSGCKKIKGTVFGSKRRKTRLTSLDLSYCELSKRGFKELTKISSDLQSLRLSPLTASHKIGDTDVLNLIRCCKNLQSFELSNYSFEMDTILLEVSRCCIHASTLLLDGIGMTNYGLQHVLQACTNMQTLRFCYGDGVTDAALHQIAKGCSGLKSLTIEFSKRERFNRPSTSDHILKMLLQSGSNLNELSLPNCQTLSIKSLPDVMHFPFLHTLKLPGCIQLNNAAIQRIADSCPQLKHLSLVEVNGLTAVTLEAIAVGCPLLESLDLRMCACFTDSIMKHVLGVMPKLFIQVTRYTDSELRGVNKEVHLVTVQDIFTRYPNTYREKALDELRKRYQQVFHS